MKAVILPQKPVRFGKFMLAERYKKLGRYLQLKHGRRLLLEVKIPDTKPFTLAECYKTLAGQAKEWHSSQWTPPAKRIRTKVPILKQLDLFNEDKEGKDLKKIILIPEEEEDLF